MPVNLTNHNYLYKVTVDVKASIFYPAELGERGVQVGGGSGTLQVQPKADCFLDGDGCLVYNDFGELIGPNWKCTVDYLDVYGAVTLVPSDWLTVTMQMNSDCSACIANPNCPSTTGFFIKMEITPHEESMSNLHKVIGTVEIEEGESVRDAKNEPHNCVAKRRGRNRFNRPKTIAPRCACHSRGTLLCFRLPKWWFHLEGVFFGWRWAEKRKLDL